MLSKSVTISVSCLCLCFPVLFSLSLPPSSLSVCMFLAFSLSFSQEKCSNGYNNVYIYVTIVKHKKILRGIIRKVRSRNWRCSLEVECLLSMHETVSLISGISPIPPHKMLGFWYIPYSPRPPR